MSEDETKLVEPVGTHDHAQGPPDAPITMIEYGDYQCPYCGETYPVLKEVKERMGDKLRLVFRNFPLSEMHPHARGAAMAAEAAAAQGKFWEMHDMLYANQQNLLPQALLIYAEELGLDIKHFEKDMNSSASAAKLKRDFRGGLMSGVNGTPTLFINGVRYDGARDVYSLLDLVQTMIDECGERETESA